VRFVRRRGMLALPAPAKGGSLNELRALVNVPDDGAWRLYVAWLVAAFRPDRPFPILAVNGEQGSAKSTLCKMARALIDPNLAPLRRPPRDERDLAIAGSNGWVVGYDNLSGIPPWLSDALCCLATGSGFGTRELYTDAEEKLFAATRPVLVNGIEDVATRGDFLDRALTLTLPAIDGEARRDEEELWQRFEEARPRILGALLDAVSTALRNRPTTKLSSKPRMADFATWVVAAEPALGWPAGAFLDSHQRNRGAANALALEASVLTSPLLVLMEQQGTWTGPARELLAALEKHADEKTRKARDWPTGPRKLSGDLRRIAPNLRRAGISVVFGTRTKTGTPITLDRVRNGPSPPSPPSSVRQDKDLGGDGAGDEGDGCPEGPSPRNPLQDQSGDGGDGGDGVLQADSDGEEIVEWTA
jgi:hypothetical protein